MAGLIAGALGGLADAAGGLAQGAIDDERKLSVQQQLSKMEEERQLRILERQDAMGRSRDKFQSDLATEAAGARARQSADIGLEYAPKTAQAETDALINQGKNKDFLASKKALANAGRADPQYSPSELANAEATRMAVGDERKRRELLQQRADVEEGNLRGDQRTRAIARIDKQLEQLTQVRGAKKTDDQDTVKKVEEKFTYDENDRKTGVTRTESSERRAVMPTPGKRSAEPAGTAKIAQSKAHEQAQAAIAKGADKERVNARLVERGYAPLP